MRPGVFVYLTGPITAKNGRMIEDHVAAALRVYLDLTQRRILSFCPQLAGAFPSAFDVPYEDWIAYDFAMIDHCTHLLLLPDWEESSGALREIEYARSKGIPTFESVTEFIASLP